MTARNQKRLAILGACTVAAVFLGANAHLIAVAFNSQPDCGAISSERAPARHSC
ncbi:hypothetical protein [Paracoccus sp. (in: a-proteobacteria)]|uniref:hypothetical protein n=1 Tax=Paracoccus sp. TaxID=267 RepID=UPI00321FB3CE